MKKLQDPSAYELTLQVVQPLFNSLGYDILDDRPIIISAHRNLFCVASNCSTRLATPRRYRIQQRDNVSTAPEWFRYFRITSVLGC